MLAMLGAHPDIYAIPVETGIFENEASPDCIREFFTEFHGAVHEKGARFLCEKTPRHIEWLELMRRTFPDARIVATVRDARDVVPSIENRGYDLEFSIERWNAHTGIVRAEIERGAPDFFAYRYEDLIADAPGVLEKVCAHIGVAYSPQMLEYYKSENDWFNARKRVETAGTNRREHRNLRNWQLHQPLMDRRGAWRGKISDDIIAKIEDRCADLMTYFGYAASAAAGG